MRITKEAILSTLPVVLAEDEAMLALAEPIAAALAERVPEIDLVRIYTRIDELPESLLDILAYDFHVEWWEYDATLEEKRAVMKKIWYVHRHKGTKGSVETAVGALFPGAAVSEWFDYEGEPYHFRMSVPIKEQQVHSSAQDYKTRVFFLVNYFKNLRSVLETIYFTFDTKLEKMLYALSHLGGNLNITHVPEEEKDWSRQQWLYLSAAMPRWMQTTILNNLTRYPLKVIEHQENKSIEIIPDPDFFEDSPFTVTSDPVKKSINIQSEKITASSDARKRSIIIKEVIE